MIESFHGEYRWLSNFHPSAVRMAGLVFPTVENAYQASKCADVRQFADFVNITPGKAKRLGNKVDKAYGWNAKKVAVMRFLLEQKFATGTELSEKLIETDREIIVEGNNWGDTFWGVCDGEGDNRLGEMIMDLRYALIVSNYG